MNWQSFLDDTREKYDHWQAQGRIRFTSKVIPVAQSLERKQWILPAQKVLEHLRNARSFALSTCRCRTLGGHCQRPREVCFTLNDFADAWLAKGQARRCSLDEAEERLAQANESGLVHLTLYSPEHHLFAVCSCCPCCCHDLQFLLAQGRRDLVAKAEYLAVWDQEACRGCLACVERCPFGARQESQEGLTYDPALCYGCGLCVTACPDGALSLELRPDWRM